MARASYGSGFRVLGLSLLGGFSGLKLNVCGSMVCCAKVDCSKVKCPSTAPTLAGCLGSSFSLPAPGLSHRIGLRWKHTSSLRHVESQLASRPPRHWKEPLITHRQKPLAEENDSSPGLGEASHTYFITHRLLSSSPFCLPYRILNINHKKELLRGLWAASLQDPGRIRIGNPHPP